MYLAQRAGEKVALKLFPKRGAGLHEATILARFQHPRIPKFYEWVDHKEVYGFLFEYCEGKDLSSTFSSAQPVSLENVLQIGLELCDALCVLHRYSLVHRDLKPKNIILDSKNHLKLLDYAYAAPVGQFHSFAGTLQYAAPEQVQVINRAVDCRSDLYSLGVLLYQLLVGKLPIDHPSSSDFIALLRNETPKPLHVLSAAIPKPLSAMIQSLLSKDPDDRPQTAEECLETLRKFTPTAFISTPVPAEVILRQIEADWVSRKLSKKREDQKESFKRALLLGEEGSGRTFLLRHCLQAPTFREFHFIFGDPGAKSDVLEQSALDSLRHLLSRWSKSGFGQSEKAHPAILASIAGLEPLLLQFCPPLGAALGLQTEARTEEIYSLEVFKTALTQFWIRLLSSERPFLLVLEHLELFDSDSLSVLADVFSFLEEKTRRSKSLALCTSRPAHAKDSPAFRQLIEQFENSLNCEPLSILQVAALLQNQLGAHRALPKALGESLLEKSRGNPRLVEILLDQFVQEGVLIPGQLTWIYEGSKAKGIDLPRSLGEWILSKAKKLDSLGLRVLTAASVPSRHFDLPLLKQLLLNASRSENPGQAIPDVEIERVISDAVLNYIIEQDSILGFRISQREVRTYFLGQLSQSELEAFHFTAAKEQMKKMAATGLGDNWIELAEHWSQSKAIWTKEEMLPEFAPLAFTAQMQATRALSQRGNLSEAWRTSTNAMQLGTQYHFLTPEFSFLELSGDIAFQLFEGQHAAKLHSLALEKATTTLEKGRIYGKLALDWHAAFEPEHKLESAKTAYEILGGRKSQWPRLNFLLAKFLLPLSLSRTAAATRNTKPALKSGIRNEIETFLCATAQYQLMLIESGLYEESFSITHAAFLKTAPALLEARSALEAPIRSKGLFFATAAVVTSLLQKRTLARRFITLAEEQLPEEPDPVLKANITAHLNHAVINCELQSEIIPRINSFTESILGWYPDPISWFVSLLALLPNQLQRGKGRDLERTFARLDQKVRELYASLKKSQEYSLFDGYQDLSRSLHVAINALIGSERENIREIQSLEEYFSDKKDYKGIYWQFCGCIAYAYLEHPPPLDRIELLIQDYFASGFQRVGGFDSRIPLVPLLHHRLRQFMAAPLGKRGEQNKKLEQAFAWFKPCHLTLSDQSHLFFVRAAAAFAEGQTVRFFYHWRKARKLALKCENPWILYECDILLARFYLKKGDLLRTADALRSPIVIAMEEGWAKRLRDLKSEFQSTFPDLIQNHSSQHSLSVSTSSSLSSKSSLLSQRNLDILVRLSSNTQGLFSPEKQMELALKETLNIVGAERALLFFLSDAEAEPTPTLEYSEKAGASRNPNRYSKNTVHQVLRGELPVVYTGDEKGELSLSESIVASDVRSIIAVPLHLQTKLVGILYCDSTISKGLFSQEDAALLLTVGNSIILSLESSRAAKAELEKAILQKDVEAAQRLKTAYDQLEQKTLEMQAIFGTIEQGICTLDSNGEVLGEYSRYLETLLGTSNLTRNSIFDLVLNHSDLSADRIALTRTVIELSFENSLDLGFTINRGNFPSEVRFSKTPQEPESFKILELEWTPIARANELASLMLTLRDVTQLRALQSQSKAQKEELERIEELIQLEKHQLGFFQKAAELLNPKEPSAATLARNLHTVKGLARMLGLKRIAELVHHTETLISELKASGTRQDEFVTHSSFQGALASILKALEGYQETIHGKLAKFSMPAQTVDRTRSSVESGWTPLPETLDAIRKSLPSLCAELMRPLPELIVEGDDLEVSNKISTEWIGALNHLIRNSLDHGFEGAAPNLILKIKLMVRRAGGQAIFTYSDNGKGLDRASLLKKGIRMGLVSNDPVAAPPPWETLANLIFHSGMSSREQVTAISGRGEGMGAFKASMEAWGGSVQIVSRPDEPFALLFSLPIRDTLIR